MNAVGIIVAAGKGLRAGGGTPKQLQFLQGKPLIDWSVSTMLNCRAITELVVVASDEVAAYLKTSEWSGRLTIAEGGETRTKSVLSGLAAAKSEGDPVVLLHDAARPGIDHACIDALLSALCETDAAAPALPVSDALKRQTGTTLEAVDRTGLYRVQTPQAFRRSLILSALNETDVSLVDDLAAVERMGASVTLTDGHERYSKITYAEDFETMSSLLSTSLPMRIGKGFDVHAFGSGSAVTLCGIAIPHEASLAGHSDADVAWHALTDAILGALALGDIGDHFPPSDPKWKGADSAVFLRAAIDLAKDKGYVLNNCDLTIICEAPKVKPHREAMRQRTAEVTGVAINCISVKATTTEKLGFTGRREGIAAEAIALLNPLTGKV